MGRTRGKRERLACRTAFRKKFTATNRHRGICFEAGSMKKPDFFSFLW
jgi:hypothetical protein